MLPIMQQIISSAELTGISNETQEQGGQVDQQQEFNPFGNTTNSNSSGSGSTSSTGASGSSNPFGNGSGSSGDQSGNIGIRGSP
jgi:hypothetical protein